jgi:hypothetical protein
VGSQLAHHHLAVEAQLHAALSVPWDHSQAIHYSVDPATAMVLVDLAIVVAYHQDLAIAWEDALLHQEDHQLVQYHWVQANEA